MFEFLQIRRYYRLSMKKLLLISFLVLLLSPQAWADIPATPVMTLYKFNGDLKIPYYTIESFQERGESHPAGYLTQGSSVIPCLVIRDGKPLTDDTGTPFVGYEVVVDSRTATRDSTKNFEELVAKRRSMMVPNHHCKGNVKHVINVRRMYALEKEPFFDPPMPAHFKKTKKRSRKKDNLDEIVRAFHNSTECEKANRKLLGRRDALAHAWEQFISANQKRWSRQSLEQAKHLDYTMRTAIYEGHLDRGCSAYGACERNIIALSISNRGRDSCLSYQGCSSPGDFQGVSSKVSQYNIWDKYLTQISGLTSCFLRSDLSAEDVPLDSERSLDFNAAYYKKIRSMYEQNVADVQKILFGSDHELKKIFPHTPLSDLKNLRHYYHPPAMGKCFPNHPRVEYMSGAVARKGKDFALIANTRIKVGKKLDEGYVFKEFTLRAERDRDVTSIVNNYPGFIVDGRMVTLNHSRNCRPYGIPTRCKFKRIERYRKMPSWWRSGKQLTIRCRVRDGGEDCLHRGKMKTVSVGSACDTQMRLVSGIR